MKEKVTITNHNWKISGPCGCGIFIHDGITVRGYVTTRNGIVHVNAYNKISIFAFGWEGREYSRIITGQHYSEKFLVTLARRFAEEIVEKNK